ncbi:lipase member H [Amyelois transitella]|uniref:lipase member H n=1 Tax=Amyelois transitella TaxID=680683 RepID=UPI00067C657A|nr:lipase member H [Amyelois transitella]
MLSMIFLLFAPILFNSVTSMYSSKDIEGYPSGYLAECPGSTKPAIITDKSLKFLAITVVGAKPNVPQKRKSYNYFQMREMSKDPTMDWSKRTVMYVGGFLDSPNFIFARTIDVYYRRLGYNVWLLDVNRFTTIEYPALARAMRAVGKYAGDMIANLTSLDVGFNPKNFEILGYSIGGQTMGLIAKRYKAVTGVTIDRLTGLDSFGICFRRSEPEDRLDRDDADFIVLVKTNIDAYGMAMAVGHVNFYVNGGENQAGLASWTTCDEWCSHSRAYKLWIAALENPHSFIGVKCDSIQQARDNECFDNKPKVTNTMGVLTDRSKPGIYYLSTTNIFPFHLGVKGTKKGRDSFSMLATNANAPDITVV